MENCIATARIIMGAEGDSCAVIERQGLSFVPLIHPAAGLHNENMQEPIKEGFRRLGEILAGYR